MPTYEDKIDLYGADGKLLESDVPLEAVSPMLNPTIENIVQEVKRSVAVNLAGIEKSLDKAAYGGKSNFIPGRELKLPIVENVDVLAEKIEKMIRVDDEDDFNLKLINKGEQLLVQLPSQRMKMAGDYTVSTMVTGSAVVQAIIDTFDVDKFDASAIKTAVLGQYPQTVDFTGANVSALLGPPQMLEGMGYGLRNIMANHVVAITKKNTLNAVALSSLLEQTANFEMGDAVGAFERFHLLGLAYQGLNANNLVFDLVKENGKGTVGTVVTSMVERALDDGVIKVAKTMPSGYNIYEPVDWALWNAYAAAGLMSSVIVNIGASRAAQGVASTLLYYNDILEFETGLPGVDYGRVEGTGVGMSFFSHSIYGGGGPGIFHGNHVVTRHSKGFAVPCTAAAMCLDAGTQMFSPEMTSGMVGNIYSDIEYFKEPLKYIADGAREIKDQI
ncbi:MULTISPECIES: coenzyme-B sulfoethylthiotransferase subunit beta [Methanobacterium]|jgi:methyl-coenzyme M reductase beta subunit|uniref:Methyl-coenzyme M reductase subunit beta n=1 Tax=Methanobacterium subterraneum TaxID=59277 RepID=A0A2H4VRE4_9EURY|nr:MULTISPECIES: coenzyme-B sulfoethylthiotransferase subunit beta [Methanobacterium]MBW4256093.1 coenzyme-B sulfoethylthiotransferase subunit beta [Methanobacterium sp. YSL]AUB55478.1 coenzyme-B sulfoethylthiotransferase subunit beta [Methanobacterium subterraneum]AUB57549.1 coenzyme-B sulfoethylthiotransferase subunit beta [Methanobacterium sp. MZ-A1]AUB60669.1 coenzyme-B sulfoethylthiotransferase subunit beta [Methanobacterium subterraneum]MCC7559538.1 coenzyme-B sulfoethylthiotransferase s